VNRLPTLRSRYRGALLGLAAGDALGTTLEFALPGTFAPIETMTGGGPFELDPGAWTDDTSMALCLAESLVEKRSFDPDDQMKRYLRWYREGHLSSNGRCFDIGGTVRQALERYEQRLAAGGGDDTAGPGESLAWCGSTDRWSAGNGSLMRLAPVPLFAFARIRRESDRRDEIVREAIELSAASSRTTHGAAEAIDACRYFAGLLIGALEGRSREELLSGRYEPLPGIWDEQPLAPKIDAIAHGSFRSKEADQIRGRGYVVDSLEAALWAFDTTGDFRSGALAAANLGDDADTTAAIFGQLAGAYYGDQAIPREWSEVIVARELIVALADRLYDLADDPCTSDEPEQTSA
jgi:ADP-ribosyl-[dinitrogen reductase] hydrolase